MRPPPPGPSAILAGVGLVYSIGMYFYFSRWYGPLCLFQAFLLGTFVEEMVQEHTKQEPCPKQPPKPEFRHAEPWVCGRCGLKADDPAKLCHPVKRS